MAALNNIYCCLKNSFCNNWMHSKLKSKVPLRNYAFKPSRGNPSKVVKLPIMSPGAENMKYLNNTWLRNELHLCCLINVKICFFTRLKPCTHDQICIRMQILHICKICVRTQIWPCVRIYSRMQNLHVCKSWKICTCLRQSANLILRMESKICTREYLFDSAE